MFTRNIFVIEMTGIFGAGYQPNLFKPLTKLLQEEYEIKDKKEKIGTWYHIDNTAVLRENEKKRDRTHGLMAKSNNIATPLSEDEWQELINLLGEADKRFLEEIDDFYKPVDVAIRRGGELQNYIYLYRNPHKVKDIFREPRAEPKLQLFLRADKSIIREIYQDPHIQEKIIKNPRTYNSTPEKAYEQQEDWFRRVERLKGLTKINREHVEIGKYAKQIIDKKIVPLSETLNGILIVPRGKKERPKVFISYKWEDDAHNEWVMQFATDLRLNGIDAKLDRWEVHLGDSFTDYMTSKINEADVVLFIITTAAVEAVESRKGAVNFEMQMATARRTTGENMRLIGIYKEGDKTLAHLRDHRYADFRDDTRYEEDLKNLIDDLLYHLQFQMRLFNRQ